MSNTSLTEQLVKSEPKEGREDPIAFVENKSQNKKGSKKKDAKKEKTQVKPKEKAQAKPKGNQDDDYEEVSFEDVKVKNPLDSLPKSKMSLDECKRGYNEQKFKDKNFFSALLPGMFDASGFSIYTSTMMSDELSGPDFIVRNRVNGYLQTMEDGRKYAFGVLHLNASETGSKVLNGYWIIRGENPIKEVFDDFLENCKWEKMEINHESFDTLNKMFYEHESLFKAVYL